MRDFGESFFSTLADMLIGNQVNTKAISDALKHICNESLLECGLIYEYEVEYSNQFHLMEHYSSCDATFQKRLLLEELSLQEQAILLERDLNYIEKDASNTHLEKHLLDMYGAETLMLALVADENNYILGFIALFNRSCKASFSKADLDSLSTAVFMIIHYISVRMYRKRVNQSQTTLKNILDNTGIDIYVNDFYTHDILYVNKSMAAPYGGQDAFLDQKCWQVLFPGQDGPCEFCPQKNLIDENGEPTKVYSWDYQRPLDGSWFRVFSAAFYWVDGRLAHVVSSADITDNKQNEAMIESLANYDQLTKLPNRRMLLKACELRIEKATATEQGYLLFFDIDGFKSINDNYGHDAGDEFLIKLGEFFASIPMIKNNIYRNGGDEFVAVVGGESIPKKNIISLAYYIHERFKKPWILKNGTVFCNTSIGVACYPEDGTTVEGLLQKADKAMYQVKKSGGGGICFGYQLLT